MDAEANREGLEKATAQLWAWKSEELRAYAIALITAGHHATVKGNGIFGPDDVPDEQHPAGQGTSGVVTNQLLRAGILEPWYGNLPDQGIVAGRRPSRSKLRHGSKVQLYMLKSRALAEAFLRRHGVSLEPIQQELAFA